MTIDIIYIAIGALIGGMYWRIMYDKRRAEHYASDYYTSFDPMGVVLQTVLVAAIWPIFLCALVGSMLVKLIRFIGWYFSEMIKEFDT